MVFGQFGLPTVSSRQWDFSAALKMITTLLQKGTSARIETRVTQTSQKDQGKFARQEIIKT